MEQLVLDIHSDEDANLIKELLKRFKKVDVMSFSTSLPEKKIKERILKGIADADAGNTQHWKTEKERLVKKIKAKK